MEEKKERKEVGKMSERDTVRERETERKKKLSKQQGPIVSLVVVNTVNCTGPGQVSNF